MPGGGDAGVTARTSRGLTGHKCATPGAAGRGGLRLPLPTEAAVSAGIQNTRDPPGSGSPGGGRASGSLTGPQAGGVPSNVSSTGASGEVAVAPSCRAL